ncbi:hypothetical protein C7M84_018133 [Penaeus vannamei]|uniref:Uncharacterized protein n=1 Tax=Penaeus vannamei TaxID=6689 RepID=A0A3R7NQB9_PENVA|nr:hypothetical protein C7M84_018133 [Penaeus vannamei]
MAGCWGSFLSRFRVRRTQGRETTASPDQNNGRGELSPGREPFSLSPSWSRGCQGSGAQAPFQPASPVGSAGGGAWDCRGVFPFSPQGCAHPGSNSALPAKRGRGEKNRRGLSRREGKAAKGGRHSETIPNVKRGAVACVKGRTTADTGGGGTGTGYPGGPRSASWREPATFAVPGSGGGKFGEGTDARAYQEHRTEPKPPKDTTHPGRKNREKRAEQQGTEGKAAGRAPQRQHDRKQGPLLRHAQGEDALRTPHHPRPGKRLTFSRGGLLRPAPDPRGTRARLAAFQPSPARSQGGAGGRRAQAARPEGEAQPAGGPRTARPQPHTTAPRALPRPTGRPGRPVGGGGPPIGPPGALSGRGRRRGIRAWPCRTPRRGVAPAGRTGEGGPWARSCVAEGLRRQRQGDCLGCGRAGGEPRVEFAVGAGRGPCTGGAGSPCWKPLPLRLPSSKAGQALGGAWLPGPSEGLPSLAPGAERPLPAVVPCLSGSRPRKRGRLWGRPGCRGRRRGCLPWPPGPNGPCPAVVWAESARADNYMRAGLGWNAARRARVPLGGGAAGLAAGGPLLPALHPRESEAFTGAWVVGRAEGVLSLGVAQEGPCLRSCWLRDRADNYRGTPMAASLPSLTVAALSLLLPFCPLLLCSFLPVLTSGGVWCLLGVWAPSCALGKLGRRSFPNFPLPRTWHSKGRGLAPRCRPGAAGVTSPRATPPVSAVVLPFTQATAPLLTFGMVSECRPLLRPSLATAEPPAVLLPSATFRR